MMDKELIRKIMMKAYEEFYGNNGKIEVKCPYCNSRITVDVFGNYDTMNCQCGAMKSTTRGI